MSKQKRKGDGYERELAKWLDWMLFRGTERITRMPLSGGGSHVGGGGKADLNGTPTIWVEAKRTERFAPYAAMEQAERGIAASKSEDMPVVITRRNRMTTEESLVVMRLEDWANMYSSWCGDCGYDVWTVEDDLDQLIEEVRGDDKKGEVVQLFKPRSGETDGEETN